ncbi:MAG: glycoside hydrolase family 19 protein [Candidatus Baltobacteraceae bacterium]
MDLSELDALTGAMPLTALTSGQLIELQTALARLGYPVGPIDGMLGSRTRNAWSEFKTDVRRDNPDLIGPDSVQALQAKIQTARYDFSSKTSTIEAIRGECTLQGIGIDAQIAYVLATVQWETAGTFAPVKEAFWESEDWRAANLVYYPYYGRGYVQLTWKDNYQKYGQILGIDLVNEPDLALEADNALFILVHGFKTGAFTGRAITEFIDSRHTDFVDARRCINGTDRAYEIAAIAQGYLRGSVTIE